MLYLTTVLITWGVFGHAQQSNRYPLNETVQPVSSSDTFYVISKLLMTITTFYVISKLHMTTTTFYVISKLHMTTTTFYDPNLEHQSDIH